MLIYFDFNQNDYMSPLQISFRWKKFPVCVDKQAQRVDQDSVPQRILQTVMMSCRTQVMQRDIGYLPLGNFRFEVDPAIRFCNNQGILKNLRAALS